MTYRYQPLQRRTSKSEAPYLDLLQGGGRDLPERHRTIRSAIGWSYSLLSAEEQRLFRRLGAFLGGFSLAAVEAVCNAHGDLGSSAVDVLSILLDKSLVKRDVW